MDIAITSSSAFFDAVEEDRSPKENSYTLSLEFVAIKNLALAVRKLLIEMVK